MYRPDFRELTICGWIVLSICIGMLVGVSVLIFCYVRLPAFQQDVAMMFAISMAWLAFGLFHLLHLSLTAIGLPLWHRRIVSTGSSEEPKALRSEIAAQKLLARRRFAVKHANLISVLVIGWLIAAIGGSIFAYDRFVGSRAGTATDLMFFAGCSVSSFGPVLLIYRFYGLPFEKQA